MISRLLLFIITIQTGSLFAQNDYTFAASVGPELSRFAQATPGFLSADFHINHKKSLFTMGYAFPLYSQEFVDNDDITPSRMKIPMLNLAYTYRFIQPMNNRKWSVGTTIGYKFGHWRWKSGITSDAFYNPYISDSSTTQITHIEISDNRETDQHHFVLGVFGEYPINNIRIIASFTIGVVFRSSYHFDLETTHYNNADPLVIPHYKDVTPFQYLSTCFHFKLGVLVPLNLFRSSTTQSSSSTTET